MAEIFLTPEVLTERAASLRNTQAEQQNVIAKIQSIIDEIVAGWEGKAQQAFMSSFENKKGTYEEFSIDMSTFADFLQSYARTMEDVDTGEATRIQQ
ncbi:MAG: WXG100 family type VII secretion target [Synergistaceae bacterium]|nr:WXG100 family type VII secretion target [Synergistaceae bacterium]